MNEVILIFILDFKRLQLHIARHPIPTAGVTKAEAEACSRTLVNTVSACVSASLLGAAGRVQRPLTLLRGAGHVEDAVETAVDPQLALGHSELLQVAVESEGVGPVQPDDRQVAVHRERGHVLGR